MTPEEVGRALQRIENAIGVLRMRERGANVPHLPAALADATDFQLAAIAASDAALVAVHYQEAAG